MARDRLALESGALDDVDQRLGRIGTRLTNTVEMGNDMADAAGHGQLADTIRHFANSWRIHRQDMIDAVTAVRDGLQHIRDQLDDVDVQLATQLENPEPGTGHPGGPTPQVM